MKILVTGAGGFLGRVLTLSLAEAGHTVVAIDNNSRGSLLKLPSHPHVTSATADVLNITQMEKLTEGVDAVYHLAYINGTKYFYTIPDKILEVGIIGTHNILKASLKNRVPHFFLASSSETYQEAEKIPTPEEIELKIPDVTNPRFSYGGGKIASELLTINYLRGQPTRWVIFRPHNVYGPDMGHEHVIPELVRKIFEGKEKGGSEAPLSLEIQGTGEETRSFIFVEDAVQAIMTCTLNTDQNGIYHVGTMNEIPIRKLVETLANILGVRVEIQSVERPAGSTRRRCPDTKRLQDLGFTPKISLPDGLKKTTAWYWEDYTKRGVQ